MPTTNVAEETAAMVQVVQVTDLRQLEAAYQIRREVFVEEQQVPAEEEYDSYEESSRHFLAMDESGKPCGTARWRYTEKGVKLERFAVLKSHRSMGVGSALLKALLSDVILQPAARGKTLYLHAQVTAMPLYAKFGFKPEGPEFLECDIRHFLMKKESI